MAAARARGGAAGEDPLPRAHPSHFARSTRRSPPQLHSTYRHDLKIYSSDEGRVQSSAAAFTQRLLDLEGTSLTPILVSLVKKDVAMLDAFGRGADQDMAKAKVRGTAGFRVLGFRVLG